MTQLIRGWPKHLTPPVPGWQRTDPLDRGLVADWRFGPVSGLLLPDYSGRGYHGTVIGADWVTAQYGPALDFTPAVFDHVNTNHQLFGNTGLFCAATETFTFEIFCKVPVDPVAGYLAAKRTGAVGRSFGITFTAVAARSPRIYLRNVTTDTTAGMDDDQWHVHTITWDATTARYYIDGAFFGNLNVGANADAVTSLILGAQSVGGGSGLDCAIASTRIWDRALAAAEIRARHEICLKRAQPMTHVWMMPWGMAPVAPPVGPFLTTYAGYSVPVG